MGGGLLGGFARFAFISKISSDFLVLELVAPVACPWQICSTLHRGESRANAHVFVLTLLSGLR